MEKGGDIYQSERRVLPGTRYGEVYGQAYAVYKKIARKTKRRPYIRSRYFKKEKVFFDYFWVHLWEKNTRERFRRLKYFSAAIDLIEHTTCKPVSYEHAHTEKERVYRFSGKLKTGEVFFVQIKEDIRKKQKYFMSCFPEI